jgi:hypothetical protein
MRSGLMPGAGAARGESTVLLAFRAHGATGGGKALRLRDLGLNNSDALKRLVDLSVIRKAGPDRFYLDEQAWAGRRQLSAGTITRVVVALALAIAAIFVWHPWR